MAMPKKMTPRKQTKWRTTAIIAAFTGATKTAKQVSDELGIPIASVRSVMRGLLLERWPGDAFKLATPIPGARIVALTDTRHNAHDCIQPEYTKGGTQWMNG